MYGAAKHVVLVTEEQLTYTENVFSFDRGSSPEVRGPNSLKELESRWGDDLLVCAPLPEPGELGQIVTANTTVDVSLFTTDRQSILANAGFC